MIRKLFFCIVLLLIGAASASYKDESRFVLGVCSTPEVLDKYSFTRSYSDPIACGGRQKANSKKIEKLKNCLKAEIKRKHIPIDEDFDTYIKWFIEEKDLSNEKLTRQNKKFKEKKIEKFCKWYPRKRMETLEKIEKLKNCLKAEIERKHIPIDNDFDTYIKRFIEEKDLSIEKLTRQNKKFKEKKIEKFCKWYPRKRMETLASISLEKEKQSNGNVVALSAMKCKSSSLNLESSRHLNIQSSTMRIAMQKTLNRPENKYPMCRTKETKEN